MARKEKLRKKEKKVKIQLLHASFQLSSFLVLIQRLVVETYSSSLKLYRLLRHLTASSYKFKMGIHESDCDAIFERVAFVDVVLNCSN